MWYFILNAIQHHGTDMLGRDTCPFLKVTLRESHTRMLLQVPQKLVKS